MKPKKLSIGKYNIESENGFSNESEAIQFIQARYPELDSETIKNYNIKTLVNKNADKSNNTTEKSTEGGEVSGKVDIKRVEKSETRKG